MGRGGREGKGGTLAFFFEGEFALFVVVFVLAATPVLTSLDSRVWLVVCCVCRSSRAVSHLSLVLGHPRCLLSLQSLLVESAASLP